MFLADTNIEKTQKYRSRQQVEQIIAIPVSNATPNGEVGFIVAYKQRMYYYPAFILASYLQSSERKKYKTIMIGMIRSVGEVDYKE